MGASLPPQIVLVSVAAGTEGHGARYLRELTGRLVSRGADVSTVIPSGTNVESQLKQQGVTVYTSKSAGDRLNADRFQRYGRFASAARGVVRVLLCLDVLAQAAHVLRAEKNRGVVIHFLDYEYFGLTAALLSHRSICERNIVVVTVHPSDFQASWQSLGSVYKGIVRFPFRTALRHVDALVCHGEWIAHRLRQQLGFSKEILARPYPSFDVVRRPMSKREARQVIGLPTDRKVILWFGMIRRNKRIDIAIEMLAKLPSDYILLVAGKAAELPAREICSLANRFGVGDRLVLRMKYIPEHEIPAYFYAADILVATHDSSFSSASGPVSDARSYGLPVVVSDVGQISEYVRRYGVGEVAQASNAASFAAKVQELLEDEKRWSDFSRNAQIAAKELSWETFGDAHWKLYIDLAARAREPHEGV